MKRWHRNIRRGAVALIAASLFIVCVDTASACPSCKEALASGSGEGGDLVRGYFWSIIFMMSMPFAIVTCFGTSMYVAVRRARAAEESTPHAKNHDSTGSTHAPERFES